ncbi:hypothetical protein ACHAWF_013758, partial [Thalassiosira exigua]
VGRSQVRQREPGAGCGARRSHRPHHRPTSSLASSSSSSAAADEELTHDEISRYSRHLVLSDVSVAGQKRLKSSSALVIGAGRLGSPCLLYLAAAGVGHIGIVDADTVDESNLQRKIAHGTSTVGVSKCESVRRRIADINPLVKVRTYEEEFTSDTAMRILGEGFLSKKKWDIVIDGSDNFPTKYLINDACDIAGMPWVYIAILTFEGQVSTFNHNGGPDYRDLLPTTPPPGDVPSCAKGGVLGVLPGMLGCFQATEAIKVLLGVDEGLLVGRVLVFDTIQMKFGEAGLTRDPNRRRSTELIDYQGFCAGPKGAPKPPTAEGAAGGRTMDEVPADDSALSDFHSISPAECLEKLSTGWSPYVLDVRLQTEHDIVVLPFTDAVVPHRTARPRHIPSGGDSNEGDGDVLVYCKAGVRGKKACATLVEHGVDPKRLYNLEGGIMGWRREVDPGMPKY